MKEVVAGTEHETEYSNITEACKNGFRKTNLELNLVGDLKSNKGF